ncbi:hypothetical protein GJU39_05840 [Pedobacter petrophilus]|uniref:Cytochrome c domain-containing protein n=1 Tax=Pedobacter petrophilus TaxID=1908241 RepID=A0A7K0FVH0_9SPHI|nr:hypothetical protein [Pedobacter petrophilus]MRX75607.1 hypothetical protein [Pedobacter petrophilus]
MVSNLIKLSLGSLFILSIYSCKGKPKYVKPIIEKKEKKVIDTCRYYAYDAGQIISNLSCKFCHLSPDVAEKDDRGWATFRGLARMDSLKIVDYTFTKKHKGWFSENGPYKTARMDTLSDCEIRNVIRYIKDSDRNIPLPGQ